MAKPIILCNTAGMTEKEWQAARMHGPKGDIPYTVGGSDVAAIFGLSPWVTPLELWKIKKGQMAPTVSANAGQMEMGHLLEPVAAHWYGKKTGSTVIDDTNLYQHADHPYALANFDRRFVKPTGEPGIPVRNALCQIQGLQLRLDNMEKRKFRWISSSGLHSGTGSPAWTHLAGAPSKRIVLTEGPMKADVIHALTGLPVLAVPGVNALTKLENSLKLLREQGLEEIKTAFDMDYAINWHVQRGYEQLMELLGRMGFRYGTYVWDPRYKGLDDYIWARLRKEIAKVG